VRVLALLARRPSTAAGVAFTMSTPGASPARSGSLRSSLAAVVLGVAGVSAAATFGGGLDRLHAEPARYGWAADFNVVDANDDIVAELVADPQLDAVTAADAATVRIGDEDVPSYAFDERKGSVGWTMLTGRPPAAPGEIALATRIAARQGVAVGDEVVASGTTGESRPLRVVGVGVGPSLSSDRFGFAALLSQDDLSALGHSAPFRDALVHVAPGFDRHDVEARYAQKYEIGSRQVPADVRNLLELGGLPDALGLFLAAVAAVALAHTIIVNTRRRARDLAVLRAIGFTTRQVARTVTVLAVSACAAGVVVGAPLGLLIGRLVWWSVAHTTGLATDPAYAWWSVLSLVPAAFGISVLVAWLPARRAARRKPASLLRSE
jgi:hypothetical protein